MAKLAAEGAAVRENLNPGDPAVQLLTAPGSGQHACVAPIIHPILLDPARPPKLEYTPSIHLKSGNVS